MVNTKDDHRKLQIKEEEKSTMKKMNLAGIIAAMTIKRRLEAKKEKTVTRRIEGVNS